METPKIIALMAVRNEQWILELSIGVALRWVDSIFLLDHASEDDTPKILEHFMAKFPDRIETDRLNTPEWDEMSHRQYMLECGRRMGASHIAMIDADEILTANLLSRIRAWVLALQPGQVLDLPMIAPWGSTTAYRDDHSVWGQAFLSTAFGDEGSLSWKPDSGYQHHHRTPYGVRNSIRPLHNKRQGGVMHLQFIDGDRLRWKHRKYKMTEVLRWPGREPISQVDWKYSQALDESGLATTPVPEEWWDGYDRNKIKHEVEPWFKKECERMWSEHGMKRFKGLNLWGWPPRT